MWGRGLSLGNAWERASFLPGHHGVWCAPPQLAACSSFARVAVGTLPPVSSEYVRPLGSTWRGSGARIQTNSRSCRRGHRLLWAKSARTLRGWERPLRAARGGAWLARWPVLRLVRGGAAEWTSADSTKTVKTGKPYVYPSCTLRVPYVSRRPRCRVHATQLLFRHPARSSPPHPPITVSLVTVIRWQSWEDTHSISQKGGSRSKASSWPKVTQLAILGYFQVFFLLNKKNKK